MIVKDDHKIKYGVYQNGANLKIIGECDLIEQNAGHKEPAIYMVSIAVMRNPDLPVTDEDHKNWERAIVRALNSREISFKAKDREEANKFITHHTKNWNAIKDFG